MRHASSLLAAVVVAAALVATPIAAQGPVSVTPAANKVLASIPATRQFEHWGQIEQNYDDEENSTSISLALSFDNRQRDAFARRGHGVSAAEMQVGFVFAGKTMMAAPEVATLVIKLTRSAEAALDFDRKTVGDLHLVIDGKEPIVFSAPLVQRNAVNSAHGRIRDVQDTYAVVLSLPQFLRVVNGQKVTARMGEQIFDFTGGPLEAMRDVASRIVVTP
jgi:hypothetical protein